MIHVEDIEDALEVKDLTRIEIAFRHLVQWAEEEAVRGAEDATELALLLDRVTAALEADRNPMPDELANDIKARSGDGMWLRDDRSYAAGARAVAARAIKWKLLFESRLGPDLDGSVTFDPYDRA